MELQLFDRVDSQRERMLGMFGTLEGRMKESLDIFGERKFTSHHAIEILMLFRTRNPDAHVEDHFLFFGMSLILQIGGPFEGGSG